MKNQLDLIFGGTFLLISIGVASAFFFTKRVPTRPAEPTKPALTQIQYPATPVPMGNGLGIGGQTASAAGGQGGGPSGGRGRGGR